MVTRIRALSARIFVTFALIASTAFAPIAAPAQPAAPDVARMEQLIQARVADKSFMGAVLVARGDQVILSKGYGSANLEWNVPNTPATKFRLGSVTKQFTAAAILLLAERGKLALEDPVKKHWPDAPAAWDRITIYHLLTHTSGIPNFTNYPEYMKTWKFVPTTAEKTIGYFRDKPLDFAPGERMNYSNSGYVVLGFLVERLSGQSYADFLRDNIFKPLGMNDSGYDVNAAILPNRAAGYVPGPGGLTNAAYVDMTIPGGAGGLYSTTGDLLRWTQGLFGGRLLKPDSLVKMTTPNKNTYAFGLVVNTVGGRRIIQHNGGIEGFNTYLAYYPDSRITVAVLGNVNGSAPDQIGPQLGQIAHGETVRSNAERTQIQVPRDRLERLAGTYEIAPTANMVISVEGNQLIGRLGGQPALPLFAESETKFFPRAVEAEIDFELGPDGKATALTLRQNGQQRRAPRVAERTAITLPLSVLQRYPGTYQLAPGFNLVITLEDGQLVSQATGQGKAPLFAEAEGKFFLKVANAQIEFEGGEQTTGLVLKQGGREVRAPRQ
jgi:CubicO group peptidase (beta-lactamase class C family)